MSQAKLLVEAYVKELGIKAIDTHDLASDKWDTCLATDGVDTYFFNRNSVDFNHAGDVEIYDYKIKPVDSPVNRHFDRFMRLLTKFGYGDEARELNRLTLEYRNSLIDYQVVKSEKPDYVFSVNNCRFVG